MGKPAKLAVSNQKGGVGKTTLAINVAGALTQREHDVLFIDLDPQGAATEGLGFTEAYDAPPPSLFDVLTDADHRDYLPELIVEHDEMDLVPSNIDMTAAEPELTLSRRGGEQLAMALAPVEDEYEYIIVDCPPYLGYLTDNALFATQNVLIPALAESTSKRGFELLYDHIDALESDYEIDIVERGVIINRIDVRKNQAQEMVDWINAAFDDVPVWEIRERAVIQKATEAGESVLAFNSDADMVPVFEAIATDLDRQFGITEVKP